MPTLEVVGRIPGLTSLTENDFQVVFRAIMQSSSSFSSQTGIVELKFVGPVAMRKLNMIYAEHDYATDVLSFAYEDASALTVPVEEKRLIATIVICTQKARAQASKYKQTVRDETMLLFCHGLIHTLGHDHISRLDQTRFEQLQDAIMKQNGYNSRNFSWLH